MRPPANVDEFWFDYGDLKVSAVNRSGGGLLSCDHVSDLCCVLLNGPYCGRATSESGRQATGHVMSCRVEMSSETSQNPQQDFAICTVVVLTLLMLLPLTMTYDCCLAVYGAGHGVAGTTPTSACHVASDVTMLTTGVTRGDRVDDVQAPAMVNGDDAKMFCCCCCCFSLSTFYSQCR